MLLPLTAKVFSFLLACLLITSSASAATVTDLGTALVPVTDNSVAERTRALGSAFERVVLKLTGDSRSRERPEFKALRQRAVDFNTLYGYERGRDGALQLRAEFDVGALGRALREAGFAVWGRERPAGEIWLLVEDATGRPLAGTDETAAEIQAGVAQFAAERGLPLSVERAPPELEAAFAMAQDEGARLEALRMSTGSAPVQLVVVLKLQAEARAEVETEARSWELRWWTLVEAVAHSGEFQGDLPIPVLETGLQTAFDTIAAHYLQATAGVAGEFEITVAGVDNAAAYARVLRYLEGQDTLGRLTLMRVQDDQLHFRALAHGGPAALAQAVGFGQVLRADPARPATYRLLSPP